MRPAREQLACESSVERVAGFVGDEAAEHRLPDQREVAEQIQSLMPNKFIRESQRRIIQHTGLREHDRILQRPTTDKAARLQFFNFMVKAERSRRRNQIGVVGTRELHVETLFTNQGMSKINIVPDAERIGWIDAQRFFAFVQDELFSNSDVLPGAILSNNANARDGFNVWQRAAVEDGNFEVVEFDIHIIDTDSIESREQVFDGRYPHASMHQRCRIGDARYGCNIGSKLEVIEIDPSENDPLAGRSRKDSKGCILARMKSDAAEFERIGDSLLTHEARSIATD
jgi:hypothetical protein